MKVMLVDSQSSAWDSFVHSVSDATSYHQFNWKKVISTSFGHSAYYLSAVDDNGDWQGVLPLVHMRSILFGNFLISVPFVNYGGLLCKNESAKEQLLAAAERLRQSLGATHVELRHLGRGLNGIESREHKVSMFLDLAPDLDSQWQAFNAKLRNQIRKAEKNGLYFKLGHLDLVDGFYAVFARNMRDLGTPVYGKSFFRKILEVFPNSTGIFAVYYKTRMVAAGIGSWFRNTLEIPWASSINDYKALCPNNMLYWEAIRFAIGKGFTKLDFGRSTRNEGTYHFKKQWGAKPVQLYWQYLMAGHGTMPDLSPSNPKYQAAIRFWQQLPVSATKALGPLIVRNIP